MKLIQWIKREWTLTRTMDRWFYGVSIGVMTIALVVAVYLNSHYLIPELNANQVRAMIVDYSTYIQSGVY